MMTRLLAFLILLIATPTFAAETWYQVNLVVFENRNAVTGGENFDVTKDEPLQYPANMVDLEEGNSADTNTVYGFRDLPVTDDEFKKAVSTLQRSSAYKVLAIKSWRQPGVDRDQAKPILIQAGETFGEHHRVEGSVTLVVSRYLHLDTNLWWGDYVQQVDDSGNWWQQDTNGVPTPPPPPGSDTGTPAPAGNEAIDTPDGNPVSDGPQIRYQATRLVRMQESRRMRSGELHYLDNPLFGLLVKVVPLKTQQVPGSAALTIAPDK